MFRRAPSLLTACLLLFAEFLFHAPAFAEQSTTDVYQRIQKFESEFRVRNRKKKSYWTLAERMQRHCVPAMSLAVINDGRIAWAKAYGILQAGAGENANTETVFSVGSLSKVATAVAVLRLVDLGELDLDADVNDYLQQWQVPPSELTQDNPVTLRRIMSHTAGLTVHGFRDFQPDERLPTTLQILNGERPSKNRPVMVKVAPGTEFIYSGGGVMIEQQVIEERLSIDFASAAGRLVLAPLEMKRSTFANPLPATHGNIAKAHNSKGTPCALPRGWESMPECAASGLWTTPTDYAQFLIALIESYRGSSNPSFLQRKTAKEMMTPVAHGPFGLGPAIRKTERALYFEHGGSNDSYKAYFRADLASGDGLVICTNSARGKALIQEALPALATAEGWPIDDRPADSPGWAPLAGKLLEWLHSNEELGQ